MSRASVPAAMALLVTASCGGGPPSGHQGEGPARTTLPTHIYHLVATIPVGGDEGSWGRLSDDSEGRRLYVAHGSVVTVIDTETDSVVGEIDSLPGVHALAVAHDLGRGFASDGAENEVAIVDLGTLRVLSRVEVGTDPDAILYVPDFQQVYAFNRGGNSATVIDAKSGRVVATIPLPGRPGDAVYDPARARIFDNIEDQDEIVVVDPATHAVEKTWPIAPGASAAGLAVSPRHHRLFAACRNGYLVMVDDVDGLLAGRVRIGAGPEAARFDPVTRLVFSANGEGTVTIAHLDQPKQLTVLQTLETAPSARTMALDPRTHRIYVAAGDSGPRPDSAQTGAHRAGRRSVPGSFKVLVYAVEPS